MVKWALLYYRLPPEPSAPRVSVWRRLKRLGALLHLEGVWVLPSTARTREQFQWLAAGVVEAGGESAVWEAEGLLAGTSEALREGFAAGIDRSYSALLQRLRSPGADFAEISRAYRLLRVRDYFDSQVGQRVRDTLVRARETNR